MRNRAGEERINLSGEVYYESYLPTPLPPNPPLKLDPEGLKLLVSANKFLAALDAVSSRIPNINLFVSMYVRKESLMSSQIEGTQATLEDIFDPLLDENTNRDAKDVINYIRATEFAIKRLKELPLCNRLIKEVYAVLMAEVRGQEKYPGEFRRSQIWIGASGSTLRTARYIPPNTEDMVKSMSELEKYINSDDDLDVLIRASLIHYQFEAIHPFFYGNGRLGRMLVTLFLMEKGLLKSPVLYISNFLKRNRMEYYDRLSEVRSKGNYEQWVKFFLQAVAESAEDAIVATDKLVALHSKNVKIIGKMGRAARNTRKLFDYIEANPIIEISKTAEAAKHVFLEPHRRC